jgi:hypothetical protein
MKKITDHGRKIISRIFRVISVSAASMILQACYGIMVPDEESGEYGIQGKVVSRKTQKPIFGIQISVEGTGQQKRTGEDGYFYLYNLPAQNEYILKVEDIDGPYNGGLFKGQTWTVTQNDIYNTLLIGMDIDGE